MRSGFTCQLRVCVQVIHYVGSRFVSKLHEQGTEIAVLIGVDDALRAIMTDWLHTLKSTTDELLLLGERAEMRPPQRVEYWTSKPLNEALATASFSEVTAVRVLERIEAASADVDPLVGILQEDPSAAAALRFLRYIVSDLADVKQAMFRKFPQLDDLDEKTG